MVHACLKNLLVFRNLLSRRVPEHGKISDTARNKSVDALLLQHKIVGARFQRRELEVGHHSLQAHQWLVPLNRLPFIHQNLFDNTSLQMLHGTNQRGRNQLAARQ